MGHIELNLPETLYHQIENVAQRENVSVDQYVIYALTRQITMGYTVFPLPEEDILEQEASFTKAVESLGPPASPDEVKAFMARREIAEPERRLDPELVKHLQNKISERIGEASLKE